MKKVNDKFHLIKAYIGVIFIAIFLCADIGFFKGSFFDKFDIFVGGLFWTIPLVYLGLYAILTIKHFRRKR